MFLTMVCERSWRVKNAGWADLGMLYLVLTASRVVDWRLLCCYLAALFLASTLPFHHSVSPASLFGTEWSTLISWSVLISQGMSGALLGVVFSVLWRDRGLRSRIPGFLTAVAAFQFFSAAFSYGAFTYWYLAAAAFVAGFIWRGRGLVLGPLLIQMCGLLSLSSAAAVREGQVSGAYAMAWLGVIAFTFAFLGLLSNRFDRLRDAADLNAAEAPPDRPRPGLTAIDITALAGLVRRLDISATIKAFSAVLAPLIAFQAGWVVRAIANFVSGSPDLDLTNVVRAFAVAGVLTPFSFLILDWAARKQAWRYVSAIIGAAAGAIAFASLGALLGFFPTEFEGSELYPIIIIGAVLLPGLGTALMARTPRIRLVGFLIAAVMPALAVFGLRGDGAPSETGAGPLLQIAFSIFLLAFLIWWLMRTVRLRIDLSGDWPRSFLLGAIPGRSFWVRGHF